MPCADASPTDAAAFDCIVSQTAPKLFRLAARILGSQADAEDVLQESYVRAFDAFRTGRFDGRSTHLTWLYRIVTRVALNQLRTRRRGDAREQHWKPSGGDPLLALEASAELQEMSKWLELLPEDQRTVLVLKELEGMSAAEVAEVLECTVGAVEQRLHRARAALRKVSDRE